MCPAGFIGRSSPREVFYEMTTPLYFSGVQAGLSDGVNQAPGATVGSCGNGGKNARPKTGSFPRESANAGISGVQGATPYGTRNGLMRDWAVCQGACGRRTGLASSALQDLCKHTDAEPAGYVGQPGRLGFPAYLLMGGDGIEPPTSWV